jgi:hypothetical protein
MSGLNVKFAKCRVLGVNKDILFFGGGNEVFELQSGNFLSLFILAS